MIEVARGDYSVDSVNKILEYLNPALGDYPYGLGIMFKSMRNIVFDFGGATSFFSGSTFSRMKIITNKFVLLFILHGKFTKILCSYTDWGYKYFCTICQLFDMFHPMKTSLARTFKDWVQQAIHETELLGSTPSLFIKN